MGHFSSLGMAGLGTAGLGTTGLGAVSYNSRHASAIHKSTNPQGRSMLLLQWRPYRLDIYGNSHDATLPQGVVYVIKQ